MTKEELEKEAEEWIKDHSGLIGSYTFVKYDYDSIQKSYLAGAEPREKEIKSLGERCLQLQKDKGNLIDKVRELEEKLVNADYQLEGRDLEIKELKEQIEKMKCYLPVNERDSNHKWFAYKNLFDTEWKIDYSVQGELPKCNTIKWFENKEAVMFYLISNGMKYYEEPRR